MTEGEKLSAAWLIAFRGWTTPNSPELYNSPDGMPQGLDVKQLPDLEAPEALGGLLADLANAKLRTFLMEGDQGWKCQLGNLETGDYGPQEDGHPTPNLAVLRAGLKAKESKP